MLTLIGACKGLRNYVFIRQRQKGGLLLGAVPQGSWCSCRLGVESCHNRDRMLHASGIVPGPSLCAAVAKAGQLAAEYLAWPGVPFALCLLLAACAYSPACSILRLILLHPK